MFQLLNIIKILIWKIAANSKKLGLLEKYIYGEVNKNLYTRRVKDEDRVLDNEVSLNRPIKEIRSK